MSIMDHLWIEKYRPKTLDEVVLPELEKAKIEEYLKKRRIPHIGFYGPPGTGKSTLSRIIVSEIIQDEGDFLKLNASLSGRIDVVRDKIIPFIKTPPIESPQKIIYFEEFDNTSVDAQLALKDIIEAGSKHVSFILTFNYENRVIDAIKSRIQLFKIDSPPFDYCVERCCYILEQEGISYNKSDVIKIVSKLYPQLRDIIKTLQMLTVNGKLVYDESKVINEFNEVVENVKQLLTQKRDYKQDRKLLSNIIRMIGSTYVDVQGVMKEIASTEDLVLEMRLEAAGYVDQIAKSVEPKLAFNSALWKLLQFKYTLIQKGLL